MPGQVGSRIIPIYGVVDRVVKFTPQEERVGELLLQALGNKRIAEEMRISEKVVKAHFHRMFLKRGITSGYKRIKLAVMLYYERQR